RVCLRLPAYSASAKDSCFIGKLGQGIECISPESGSLFQDFLNGVSKMVKTFLTEIHLAIK
ncbi:hypothetical protein, partial [Azotobacter beijerinckii]|uniref:hypothetical protein n=1 Tax=Azotobacter beijerinckii TaxID=170623 RepID=UPI002955139B